VLGRKRKVEDTPTRVTEGIERMVLRHMLLFEPLPAPVETNTDTVERWATERRFTFEPTELVFSPNQPSCFYEAEGGIVYRGQSAAKRRIEIKIAALTEESRFKCLFTGPAGTGKTALAWIVAQRIIEHRGYGRFFEILPNQITTKDQLDAFMQQLEPGDIVFIDEIHVLCKHVGVESFYPVLADTGAPRYPLGSGGEHSGEVRMLPIHPSVSWIGATTEPGELDATNGGALRRRLAPEIPLEAPTVDELVMILLDQDVQVEEDAAISIALRAGSLPWQLLSVYEEAKNVAAYEGAETVTEDHAVEAFDLLGLDSNGLYPDDRRVIEVLLQAKHRLRGKEGIIVHRMSEPALLAAAGLDRATYKQRVQPKLVKMGYLSTTGGQTLTEKALEHYGTG
jgi:Holliday junction resolvasome RuvABC ATP-dependent DNA helicase subunit